MEATVLRSLTLTLTLLLAAPALAQSGLAPIPLLRPDLLHLQAMSETALQQFRLPACCFSNRAILTGAFSPDANRFAFLAQDIFLDIDPKLLEKQTVPPTKRCALWVYNLASESLTHIPLPLDNCEPESVVFIGKGTYRSGTTIHWLNGELYLTLIAAIKSSLPIDHATPAVITLVLNGDTLQPVAPADQPAALQSFIASRTTPKPWVANPPVTNDRRYAIENVGNSPRSCDSLAITTLATHRHRNVADGCASYLVDPVHDLLYLNESAITEVAMSTGIRRVFVVPPQGPCGGASYCSPQLIALQSLPTLATRLAYSVKGDCEPESSDYSQPGQPTGPLGETPNKFSVCFVTIPPATKSQTPHSSVKPHHPASH